MAAMGWQRWQKCTLSSPAEMEKGFLASVILSKLHCAAPPGFPNSTADKPLAPTGSPRRSKAGLGLQLYGASWQVHHRGWFLLPVMTALAHCRCGPPPRRTSRATPLLTTARTTPPAVEVGSVLPWCPSN